MTQSNIFTEVQRAEVNIPPSLYIEAIDRPTVLSMLYYSTMSLQQMNLLPEKASRNDTISPQVYITDIGPPGNA